MASTRSSVTLAYEATSKSTRFARQVALNGRTE